MTMVYATYIVTIFLSTVACVLCACMYATTARRIDELETKLTLDTTKKAWTKYYIVAAEQSDEIHGT